MRCTRTAGAASAVPLAFMPFDMLQTTCILTTCGCSGMLAMYRRRDDQRESLDWQSRGQAFGARALNPIECGPLPANVSFLSVLDDKTSQMLFVLWRQVALVKGHFFERTASCEEASELTPVEMYFTIIPGGRHAHPRYPRQATHTQPPIRHLVVQFSSPYGI